MHVCDNCGSEVRLDDVFCPKCGTRLNLANKGEELNRNMDAQNNYTYSEKKAQISIIRKVVSFISNILIVLVSIGVTFNIIFPLKKVMFDQDAAITLGIIFLVSTITVYLSKINRYILLLTISINVLLAYKIIYLYDNILFLQASIEDIYLFIINACVAFTLLYTIFNIISLCIVLGRKFIIFIIIAAAVLCGAYYINNKPTTSNESFAGNWSGTFKLDTVKYEGSKDWGDGYYFNSINFKPNDYSMEFTISKIDNSNYELKFKNTNVLSQINVKKVLLRNNNIVFTMGTKDDNDTSLVFTGKLKENNIISGTVSINNLVMGKNLITGTWTVSKVSNTGSEVKDRQTTGNDAKTTTSNDVNQKNKNSKISSDKENTSNDKKSTKPEDKFNDVENKGRLELEEFKLAGLKLGLSKDDLFKIKGEVKCIKSQTTETYNYKDCTVNLWDSNINNGFFVCGITTEDSSAIGPRDIKIGDSADDVLKKFPNENNPIVNRVKFLYGKEYDYHGEAIYDDKGNLFRLIYIAGTGTSGNTLNLEIHNGKVFMITISEAI